MAARKLTEEIKFFIVAQLAMWKTPSEVVDLVREEYEKEVTRQTVHGYDPTTKAGEALSAELREFFFTTRRDFEQSIKGIAISHQSYRLKELHRLYVKNSQLGNVVEARLNLEQAAREVGGAYTNKRTVVVDTIENARRALAILREEFAGDLEAGKLDDAQLVSMVAEDHAVDPVELVQVSELVS